MLQRAGKDGKLLEKLNRKLKKCYQFLKDSAPKENGITLDVPLPKKLAVKTTTTANQHPPQQLQLPNQ